MDPGSPIEPENPNQPDNQGHQKNPDEKPCDDGLSSSPRREAIGSLAFLPSRYPRVHNTTAFGNAGSYHKPGDGPSTVAHQSIPKNSKQPADRERQHKPDKDCCDDGVSSSWGRGEILHRACRLIVAERIGLPVRCDKKLRSQPASYSFCSSRARRQEMLCAALLASPSGWGDRTELGVIPPPPSQGGI